MLRSLTRWQAALLAAVLTAAALWSISVGLGESMVESTAAATSGKRYSDVALYTDIAHAVAAGESYYSAAPRLQREHNFPTRPFVTVRLPTLAWLQGRLGLDGAHIVLVVLAAGTVLVWIWAMRGTTGLLESRLTVICLMAGGAMAITPGLAVMHELWAGMLCATAMALLWRGQWPIALACMGLALVIRELALPLALLAAGWALLERRWRELAGWAGLLAGYAALLLLHARAVNAAVLPADKLSQGWNGMRGAGAPLRDIADVTIVHLLPAPIACLVVALALIGMLGMPARLARLALPYCLTFAVLLALFARPANFYWAIQTVPAVLTGLAFLPRVVADLASAIRPRPSPPSPAP